MKQGEIKRYIKYAWSCKFPRPKVTPYGDIYLVNFGVDNGLLPDGTKPLPETMLIYHQNLIWPLKYTFILFWRYYD